MKKLILFTLIFALVIPVMLVANVNYLGEEEYKKLKKKERLHYWEQLDESLAGFQQRKADAVANSATYQKRIDELKDQLADANTEYDETYNGILDFLGISKSDFASIIAKLKYYNGKLDRWNDLSDEELWKTKKAVRELLVSYKEYRGTNYAKVPDFRKNFSDLDNKIKNMEMSLENAKPKYYEDEYTVLKGESLSKISGYSFIYNDISKWPIIFRANRDQIKDPNIIQPNQVLKIPRGLPYSWKVYTGENLWKIASYPEVYGSGAKWPMIFRANKDQIKDPDLIYPNQIFEIPRD